MKTGLGIDYVKVDRKCPRCYAHRYHFANRKQAGKKFVVRITCAECGHDWKGRHKKDEWN